MPQIPLAAVFSFLKDMRGALTWTAQDLIGTLKVSREDAEKILLLLQMQGYVQKTEDGEWLTTAAGVPGFIGFAVGRTTFWNPLVNYRSQKITREAAVAQIAGSFRAWVDLFQKAK